MTSTVSAIIIGFNYARFLSAAIESVLAQTRVPDEIIFVDDGSTDDTAEVVARYADKGVHYIYRENGGVSAARNTGIGASHGDFIAFLDGDDRWLPEKTALQLDHFERYPSAGVVTGGECQVYESGAKPFVLRRKPVGAASFYPGILIENTIGNSSLTMVRRECLDTVGLFDEKVGLGQDWELWIRIASAYKVGVVDAILIYFTRHAQSYTAGVSSKRIASNKAIQGRYIGLVRSPFKRFRLVAASRSMTLYYIAATFADTPGQRFKAFRFAIASAMLDPFYESRNKAALLVRTALGRSAFNVVKRVTRRDQGLVARS